MYTSDLGEPEVVLEVRIAKESSESEKKTREKETEK